MTCGDAQDDNGAADGRTGCHGRDPAPTGRIRLGEGRIWPEEPAAAAMAEKVGRGRDWRRADGDEEAATAVGVKDPRLLLLEDEGAARIWPAKTTTTAAVA